MLVARWFGFWLSSGLYCISNDIVRWSGRIVHLTVVYVILYAERVLSPGFDFLEEKTACLIDTGIIFYVCI